MSDLRFIVCPVLSFVPSGELELSNVQFTEAVDGKGTVLTADAFLSTSQTADRLKELLNYQDGRGNPRDIAIYVRNGNDFLWGGVLQTRPWTPDKQAFTITATSWKAWLYQRYLSPDVSTNPVTDTLYSWTATDQFTIARGIIAHATSEDGCPVITTGTDLSGVTRDLNVNASDFIYAGDAIDRMADRERGFEWDIEIIPVDNKYPSLFFAPYYPKRQDINSTVIFSSDEFGGNILDFSSPDDSAENIVTRVWATGSGTAGADLLIAYDADNSLPDGQTLLVESKEYANSSTTNISTVASHAQGIRAFHSSGLQQVTVKLSLEDPDFNQYRVGDKIRLVIKDEVLDIDFGSVRIVRRTFNVNPIGSGVHDYVELLIDLNDTDLPENEEAVS